MVALSPRLEIVLRVGRPRPFPVNVVTPEGRLSVPKVRAFVHFAVSRLRIEFARLAADAGSEGHVPCLPFG